MPGRRVIDFAVRRSQPVAQELLELLGGGDSGAPPKPGAFQRGRCGSTLDNFIDWAILGEAECECTVEDVTGAERVCDLNSEGRGGANSTAIIQPNHSGLPEGDGEPCVRSSGNRPQAGSRITLAAHFRKRGCRKHDVGRSREGSIDRTRADVVEVEDRRNPETPSCFHRRQCSSRPEQVAEHGVGSGQIILGEQVLGFQQSRIRIVDDGPFPARLHGDRRDGR